MRSSVTKVFDCFFLLRIPLLAPVWTILILGWVTGNPHATPGGYLTGDGGLAGQIGLWAALCSFSLTVGAIYVVNQIADIESDRINRKLFLLPYGLVSVRTAWVLAVVCSVLGMAGAMLFDVTMVVLYGASLLLGILYDLPPARLKDRPWGGTLACFLGHGTLTYLVGWYAAAHSALPEALSQEPWRVNLSLLADGAVQSVCAGFANAAVFVTTTIPDAPGDKAIGKRTFAVAYGEKPTAVAAFLFCLCALVSALWLEYNRLVMVVPTAVSLLFFGYLVVATDRTNAFKAFKWPVFLLSALVAVYIPVYVALILVTFFGSRLYYRKRLGIDYPTFRPH